MGDLDLSYPRDHGSVLGCLSYHQGSRECLALAVPGGGRVYSHKSLLYCAQIAASEKGRPLFKSLRRRFVRKRRDGAARRLDTERSLLQALQESQARTERLFESNIVGIFYADERARITGANDAFLSMVGHEPQALARGTLSWIELTPPGWEETDQRAMAELMATGACAAYEKEFRRADGHRVPVLVG